ncbi:MAG: MBL fold metallo-hydrolase [bacterium]|nr:MBL fold metallo-hydrolase [bacterium]
MKICVLASGSSGNAIYVEEAGCGILVDAGLSRRELGARLGTIGVDLGGVSAVLVSHEHGDHVQGLAVLHRVHGIPVHANRMTASGLFDRGLPAPAFRLFRTGADFSVGPFTVSPFPVPHDALDPVGFVLSAGGCRVGISTDLGHPAPQVKERLRGCRAIVIEANHDGELLAGGDRHPSLKERIRGGNGHLSNEEAAALVAAVATEGLRDVFLAHLSRECNRPELARAAVEGALRAAGRGGVAVRLTFADRASDLIECAAENSVPAAPAGVL